MYVEGAESQARRVLARFGPVRESVAIWLGLEPRGKPVIYLEKDGAGMQRRAPGAPDWATAVVRDDDRIVFRLDRVGRVPSDSLELVLAHEIVHQVLNHLGGKLPRWFEEGLCVYYAGVPFLQAEYSVERLAAAGHLPGLREVEEGFFGDHALAARSYKCGHSAVDFFLSRYGVADLRRLLRRVGAGQPFEDSFRATTGIALARFESDWREAVTPSVPFFLFVLLENIGTTLIVTGAVLVFFGWLRLRLRRERAMRSLGE